MSTYGLWGGLGMLGVTSVNMKNCIMSSSLFQPACLGLPRIQDDKNKIREDQRTQSADQAIDKGSQSCS